ncbi:TadA family conjugal transfer-associated ATPase [Demequina sp. SO4-13]|uniref:TadA family conjugal transfer-associated ATPase n=1 Tax=Demequina sp. SO4-13 TaxID=3401027 RepID=UPI003AF92BBD
MTGAVEASANGLAASGESGPEPAATWAGPLAMLLRTPGVTDVLVHRPGEAWVDKGLGLERVEVALPDADAVRALAVRLAAAGGQRLDDASPVADARLPDGNRLHAVLPPVAPGCAAISLRVVRAQALTLADLAAAGAIDARTAALLARIVRARLSVLVCGATGSGKTTLMASLLSLAAPHERIVVIEEAGEIAPAHPHVVRLVERRANVEGAGSVGLARLVREALRMRPDRVVLGECRGAELREVLSAFNTGHRGGMTTIHANSPGDVPVRLTTLGALAGMPAAAVEAQAAAGLDVVLHVARSGGVRRLTEVCVLRARSPGLAVEAAWSLGARGRWGPGPAWEELLSVLGEAADAVA